METNNFDLMTQALALEQAWKDTIENLILADAYHEDAERECAKLEEPFPNHRDSAHDALDYLQYQEAKAKYNTSKNTKANRFKKQHTLELEVQNKLPRQWISVDVFNTNAKVFNNGSTLIIIYYPELDLEIRY